MRVHKTSTDGRHEITGSKAKTDQNNRFSKILEVRRKESMRSFDLAGHEQNSAMAGSARSPQSIAGAPVSRDVDQLAAEIVDHISSHQANGTHSAEIQFNSQTLEGLRVSVRSSEQGQVAILFLTPIQRVAALVQQNAGSLRSALENKGIRVTQLVVSRRAG